MDTLSKNDKLFTHSYLLILCANFLLYFGFYLIMPVLPFYLEEIYMADKSTIGEVLSCYIVAALCIRPFSGYLLDTFQRKPLYLLAYLIFSLVFIGYIFAGFLWLFVSLRIVQGLAFGMVTVGGNTIVIDIMPSSRRGEGIGYYGIANNMAMSIGPMIGLFMHSIYSFNTIFVVSLLSCLFGLAAANAIKTKPKEHIGRQPLSLDRFILLKGISGGIALLLLSIPYGMTTTYIAMYAEELGIEQSGTFFTLLAVGIATSRIFAGKLVDRGYKNQVITISTFFAILVIAAIGLCKPIADSGYNVTILFHVCALFMGWTYGTLFPAYNTFFVDLAPHNQRGTAISTYLTSWDVGVSIGLLLGGYLAHYIGFHVAYYVGALLIVISWLWFKFHVTKRN